MTVLKVISKDGLWVVFCIIEPNIVSVILSMSVQFIFVI